MARKKKKAETGARILIILIGVCLLIWSASGIGLYALGNVTEAHNVTVSRRESGRQDEAADAKNYHFDVSYTYTVGGTEYDGLDTGIRGEWLGPAYDGTVHYLPFARQISSMYAEDACTIGMFIPVGFGLALILLGVIPRRKASKKHARALRDPVSAVIDSKQPVTMAWLMEHTEGYDDRLEEYYQNGWDKDDPSWKCTCGKWNTGNYCERCGKFRR